MTINNNHQIIFIMAMDTVFSEVWPKCITQIKWMFGPERNNTPSYEIEIAWCVTSIIHDCRKENAVTGRSGGYRIGYLVCLLCLSCDLKRRGGIEKKIKHERTEW